MLTLLAGGWSPYAPTGPGTPLHHVYHQATTVAWLGIVACQVGTAFAARTERVSLRQIGIASNRLLLSAVAIALLFAALVVYTPLAHSVFGTASLSPLQVATVAPFPFVVWGADELRRWAIRRHQGPREPENHPHGRDLTHPPATEEPGQTCGGYRPSKASPPSREDGGLHLTTAGQTSTAGPGSEPAGTLDREPARKRVQAKRHFASHRSPMWRSMPF
jgi:hypothetical protein